MSPSKGASNALAPSGLKAGTPSPLNVGVRPFTRVSTMSKWTIPLFITLALAQPVSQFGGAQESPCPTHLPTIDASESGDDFDWDDSSPIDFLEFLKGKKSPYTVVGCHEGWVQETHLEALISLLDSEEPCANVNSVWSSFIDLQPSTIGNEAAYLIEGYLVGHYPPGLNSIRPKPNKEGILKWWQERNTE